MGGRIGRFDAALRVFIKIFPCDIFEKKNCVSPPGHHCDDIHVIFFDFIFFSDVVKMQNAQEKSAGARIAAQILFHRWNFYFASESQSRHRDEENDVDFMKIGSRLGGQNREIPI